FFQAEDGIRDFHVTGVQTCALPILVRPAGGSRALRHGAMLYLHGGGFAVCGLQTHRAVVAGLARRTGLPVLNVEYRQLPGNSVEIGRASCRERGWIAGVAVAGRSEI